MSCSPEWKRMVMAGVICLAFIFNTLAESTTAATSGKVDYTKDIKPIFEQHCLECHGSAKHKGGLRLDDRESVFRGGDSGKATLVIGKSTESELIKRVSGQVAEDEIMPPKGERLTTEEINRLKNWINQGAFWPESSTPKPKHWAYVKPTHPEPPEVKNQRWIHNPIDNFILARLEKENLKPSPEADRAALLRRLSLDLTGLPPTIEEVDAFLADKSKDAYEKQVERLLASPHYGEKWARHWLDLARYADTHGYERDPFRSMWPYRDWVIAAYNRDLSFDKFTIEQIAGDMLPNATQEQIIASGFHRNTMLNLEGGVDKEEARVETIVDRVNTTGSVWLGSTIGCSQCHTHKYDPFTLKEYYQLFAFFNNADEPEFDVPLPGQTNRLDEIKSEITKLEADLKKETPELNTTQPVWEKKQLTNAFPWSLLNPVSFSSAGGATLTKLDDKSLLASGVNPTNDTYTITAQTDLTNITGLRLEIIPDPSLPEASVGRHTNGSFVLSRFEVMATPADASMLAEQVDLKTAAADYTQEGFSAVSLINGREGAGWATGAGDPNLRVERAAYFQIAKPAGFKGGTTLTFTLKHKSQWAEANLGRFRLSVTSAENPISSTNFPPAILHALSLPPDQRSRKQKKEIRALFRSTAPELKGLRDRIASLRKEETELKKKIPTTLVMEERKEPRETHIFIRGNFLSPGDKVSPGVPAVLPPLPAGEPTNRLTLAYWLVSPENPLTARVTVNRIWEQYFGHGIVETVEDFGTQGEPPTHPQLLDWLATEFIRQGWSMKAMHRLIVNSATYRQSSTVPPALLERDPYNRLLARGPRFRVPAETVRDIALKASGLLSPKIGGPSVFPYQPDGIWTQIYSGQKWKMSEGEDKYRRGLYTFWRRTSPYPAFMSFDAPSRELICTRRPRSNTPLQALGTLNDPAFVEAAQALARRIVNEGGKNPSQRAAYAFRLCTSRLPRAQELKRLLSLYGEQLSVYQKDPKAAGKLATSELGKAPENMNVEELAAWTVIANVLLNLDETITKS